MFDVTEIGADSVERLCAVRNAIRPRDPETPAVLVDWKRQAEDMVWLVAAEDGEDIAAGYALTGWHSPPGVGHLFVGVLPDARGRGAGSALLRRLGGWLGEHGCVEATADVGEEEGESLTWLARRGFREVGRSSIMSLDLELIDAPEVAPPPGVEISTWDGRPELVAGMYDVMCEASPDIPGEENAEIPSLEGWLENDMMGESDDPEAVFVATEDGSVIGFAKLSYQDRTAGVAFHDLTGVLRSARGRGIASALKRAEIAWAKQQGFRLLKTFNEERNEPIRRLNERHGYRAEPGFVRMRGPAAPGSAR